MPDTEYCCCDYPVPGVYTTDEPNRCTVCSRTLFPERVTSITAVDGDYSHLVLQWGEQKLRVTPNGEIEVNGERVGTWDTGEALVDWARYMAEHTPAHPSADVTAPDPGRQTIIVPEPDPVK